jgi:hypothetical protein
MEAVAINPQVKPYPSTDGHVAKSTVQTAKKMATTISVGKKDDESPYNAEFVKMVQQNRADYKAGKGKKVSLEEFLKLCEID